MSTISDIAYFHSQVTGIDGQPKIDGNYDLELLYHTNIDPGKRPTTATNLFFEDEPAVAGESARATRLFFAAEQTTPSASVFVTSTGVENLSSHVLTPTHRDGSRATQQTPRNRTDSGIFVASKPIHLLLLDQDSDIPDNTPLQPYRTGNVALNIGNHTYVVSSIQTENPNQAKFGTQAWREANESKIVRFFTEAIRDCRIDSGVAQLAIVIPRDFHRNTDKDYIYFATILSAMHETQRDIPLQVVIASAI